MTVDEVMDALIKFPDSARLVMWTSPFPGQAPQWVEIVGFDWTGQHRNTIMPLPKNRADGGPTVDDPPLELEKTKEGG